MEDRMRDQLAKRRMNGSLRIQQPLESLLLDSRGSVDFSTNDYLGLAQCQYQKDFVDRVYKDESKQAVALGSTGSRLLSGDTVYARQLETWLAELHQRPAATLFNSGYDANLSILSSVIIPGDLIILDELCHNSSVMGVRMSRQRNYHTFSHNSVKALESILEDKRSSHTCCLIVVESVYSMDGDIAPLQEILDLATRYIAKVVVDEAHGLGIYGRTNPQDLKCQKRMQGCCLNDQTFTSPMYGGTGVLAALELERHPALLCSVHTFGKAAGCHGAVICGSTVLRDFLWNYARPLVYSTALPLHSLVAIKASYTAMISHEGDERRARLFYLVNVFCARMNETLKNSSTVFLWPSPSPIQALVLGDNDTCLEFCNRMWNRCSIRLYPVRAPTVPRGLERVRIIIHAHNTEGNVNSLCEGLLQTCSEMRLLALSRM